MRPQWGPPPRRRPPWWPENQPWPPARRWRRGGLPFFWRMGCAILGMIALVAVAAAVVTALVGTLMGWLLGPTAFRPGTAQVVLVMTALLLVAFAVVAQRGIRRFSRPMDNLIEAAGRIEKGDYSAQLPESGPQELVSVARAFNAMSARLKTSDEQRRTFLADVTHELRTPLSVIRGQAEAIADGVYPGDAEHVAPIIDATRTLELLVDDLRTLTLSDTGSLVPSVEPVDPAALVHDTLTAFDGGAGRRRGADRRGRQRRGHPAGAAPPRLRAVRQRPRLARIGPRPGHRARRGDGARRHDRDREPAGRRHHRPADAARGPVARLTSRPMGRAVAAALAPCPAAFAAGHGARDPGATRPSNRDAARRLAPP